MNRYLEKSLLLVLVLAVIAPLFYYGTPFYESSPDIAYVKAKVLHVLEGNIFTDPVSGFDTLHPPLFHIFLAPLKGLGLSFRLILMLASIFSVSLTIVFTFKTVEAAFDRQTAFLTCLLLPFIVDFMGSRNILLANSFYFSVPFYLAGLWLYIKFKDSIKLTVLAGIIWGMTFFISPVYVFLLGLTFLYELVIARRKLRFAVILGSFLVTISPYIFMAISVYARDLWGSTAFGLWRGLPDGKWLADFAREFIAPTQKTWLGFPSFVHFGLLVLAVFAMIRYKRVFWFIPVALIAYLLTYYNFTPQYALRVHYFLSIFLVATAIRGMLQLKVRQIILLIPVLALTVFSVYSHYEYTNSYYEREKATFAPFAETAEKLWANLDRHLVKGSYIFCTKEVYRYYIMTHYPVHSLGAYRTLEYFQVNSRVADDLEHDYREVLFSMDLDFIKKVIAKYDIKTAVISGSDYQLPLFQIIAQAWTPVYEDEFFVIYKRPW